jgi:hypothetical protein
MPLKSAPRAPRWYGVPVRVLLVTVLGTLLSFAVSLFLAIIGTVTVSAIGGAHPDMRIAYRSIALPAALVAGSVILILVLITEIRHYRQTKTLQAIEKLS